MLFLNLYILHVQRTQVSKEVERRRTVGSLDSLPYEKQNKLLAAAHAYWADSCNVVSVQWHESRWLLKGQVEQYNVQILQQWAWINATNRTADNISNKTDKYKEVLNFDLYKLSEFLGHNPRNSQIDKRPSRQQSFQTLNISFLIFIYTKWSHAFHNYWISVAAAGEELPQQGANFHWG